MNDTLTLMIARAAFPLRIAYHPIRKRPWCLYTPEGVREFSTKRACFAAYSAEISSRPVKLYDEA